MQSTRKRQTTATRRKDNRRVAAFVGNIRQKITAHFGIALRNRRNQLGITQAELAASAHLNRSYLSEVECGQVSISLERAERLAKALGCRLVDLLKED